MARHLCKLVGSDPEEIAPQWVQIWLEAGAEGQVFTYANAALPPLAPGDLVQVRLRGRRQSGLVVDLLASLPEGLQASKLQPVEALLQRAAVGEAWQQLINQVAQACHTSRFQTLKSALPAAWLGQRRQPPSKGKRPQWQVELVANPEPAGSLTQRQGALLELLRDAGGSLPMAQLCGPMGGSRSVLAGLEKRCLVRRQLAALQGQQPGFEGEVTLASQLLQPGPAIRTAWRGKLVHQVGRRALGESHGG